MEISITGSSGNCKKNAVRYGISIFTHAVLRVNGIAKALNLAKYIEYSHSPLPPSILIPPPVLRLLCTQAIKLSLNLP